jgi:penicillin-binding protein 1A
MAKKFALIFSSLLCLLCAFIAYSLAFFGTDLKPLRTYPVQNYPQNVYNALIAAEDPNFEESFLRRNACIVSDKRCGSSLRQMAVKHLTFKQKTKLRSPSFVLHVIVAMPRANLVVKDTQFLDYILDQSYFGRQVSGIRAALHVHFETTLTNVTIAQAATLSALLKSPSSLSANQDRWRNRPVKILNTMHAKKFITSDQLDTAIKETASNFF